MFRASAPRLRASTAALLFFLLGVTASLPARAQGASLAPPSPAAPDRNEVPPRDDANDAKASKARPIDASFLVGIHAAVTIPAGEIGAPVGAAGTVGLEAGARFYHGFYATALLDLGLFSSSAASQKSVSSLLVGARGGYLTNAEGFGFAADIGMGYRSFSLADATGTSLRRSGPDVLLGAALHFKFGENVRLFLPRVDFAAGPADGLAHYLASFGVVAMYNFDFGRRHRRQD